MSGRGKRIFTCISHPKGKNFLLVLRDRDHPTKVICQKYCNIWLACLHIGFGSIYNFCFITLVENFWETSVELFGTSGWEISSLNYWKFSLMWSSSLWKCGVLATLWIIWLERNNGIYGDSSEEDVNSLWNRARFLASLWASKEFQDTSVFFFFWYI